MAKGNTKVRFVVYTIREREGQDKGFWVRIGSAWLNSDKSINVLLDALPIDGRLHIRLPSDDEGAKGGKSSKGKYKGKPSKQRRQAHDDFEESDSEDTDSEDESSEDVPF